MIQLTKSGEPFKKYQGWAGVKHPDIIESEFAKLTKQDFIGYYGLDPKKEEPRVALFEVAEKLLGQYLPSENQEIGDSFGRGTKVSMSDGSLKEIQDVIVGDEVVTDRGYRSVIGVHSYEAKNDILKIVVRDMVDGVREMRVTEDHMLRVDKGYDDVEWVMAGDLIGDECLVSPNGSVSTIDSISVDNSDKNVYCLSVYKDHCFFAENVLAHNCVSWGMKHAVELLECAEILLKGDNEQFKYVFAPYIYGISRVQIGGGRINGDGSVGSWAADGVKRFGVLFSDTEGCPPYSGSVAKKWGNRPGPPSNFVEVGKKFPVKSTAAVTTWDELVEALFNYYPVTVASDIGYSMKPGADGFHIQNTSWAHQMCIAGLDKGGDGIEPHVYIWNSWGDAHGTLKDFRTGKQLPPGYLRVKKRDVEKMLRQKDSWAISAFEGFKTRSLPKELFIGM